LVEVVLKPIATQVVGTPALPLTVSTFAMALPRSDAERRQLTILFCDLAGSTAFTALFDPEDLSGVIRRFQSTCATVITLNGGMIARFMGDGILAYFGYPQAREDNAECAVRAALDICGSPEHYSCLRKHTPATW
jgi:class 3 adenylate cyclase